MKKYTVLFAASLLLTIVACNNNNEDATNDTADAHVVSMLQTSCFSCHNADKNAASKIAPTMAELREAYIAVGADKESFSNNIIEFVNEPNEANSHMPEAVKSYGMMPKLSYKAEDLKLIAEYIYDNDLSSDEWYANYKSGNTQATDDSELSYEDKGRNMAMGTKAQLGKNLMGALKAHGAPGAVTFCNTRAIPLTDSMSKVYKATIKRVSDKPRNPNNKANEEETAYINKLKEQIAKGEKLQPQVTETENKVIAYYAIETNKMCLQCHGDKEKDILPETWTNIQKAYPNDNATGYGENQVRGIWVVTMEK
ncbi:MAG: DUF3365 domain-containing protein [Chitinophagaceae bacterium]|nr:DUF3365 domain-containing protein [Chitinophagaceae bacterium]